MKVKLRKRKSKLQKELDKLAKTMDSNSWLTIQLQRKLRNDYYQFENQVWHNLDKTL